MLLRPLSERGLLFAYKHSQYPTPRSSETHYGSNSITDMNSCSNKMFQPGKNSAPGRSPSYRIYRILVSRLITAFSPVPFPRRADGGRARTGCNDFRPFSEAKTSSTALGPCEPTSDSPAVPVLTESGASSAPEHDIARGKAQVAGVTGQLGRSSIIRHNDGPPAHHLLHHDQASGLPPTSDGKTNTSKSNAARFNVFSAKCSHEIQCVATPHFWQPAFQGGFFRDHRQ